LLAATTLASEDNRQAMSHHIDMAFTPHLKRFKSTDFTQSQALIAQGFADTKTQIADHQRSGHSPELWSVIYKSHTLSWHNDFPQSPALVSPTSTPPPTAV
jgi:hypothetical protein